MADSAAVCTEKATWEDALGQAAILEAAGAWDRDAPNRPPRPRRRAPPPEPAPLAAGELLGATQPLRVSIADAIDLYKP